MNFALNADQEALREGVRNLCDGRFPLERVRALEERPTVVDRDAWRELGEAGVFSLRLPESEGGAGLGWAEAALVFEQMGRALVPGPLVAAHLAAGRADGAATGEQVVGLVELRRRPLLVEHLEGLDGLVAVDEEGVWAVEVDGLAAEPVAMPVDPLTPLWLVNEVHRGAQLGGPDVAEEWRLGGAVLVAALQIGIAQATTDLATAYAKERRQFGRPIGSFQAVKHLCADMLVRTEVARAALYSAGAHLDEPVVGDVARAVSAAKVTAGEAARRNGKDCIQVHGGMGFTWEAAPHLYLKRAWVLDTVFGTVDEHAEALFLRAVT